MNGNKKQGYWNAAVAVLAVVALALAGWAVASTPGEQVEPRANVPCYREQGGAKWIAGSGCEWEMQSGSTLDIQSTSVVTFGGDIDVVGGLEIDGTLDVDGATTLNSTLDVDGNISSGTGAITVTDGFVVTGAVDFDSTLDVDGNTDLDDTQVDGEFEVTGVSLLTGTVTTVGDAVVGADLEVLDDLEVADDLTVGGDLYVTGHSWITTTTTITGDTSIVGDLDVTGNVTATENLSVTGDSRLWSDLYVGQGLTVTENVSVGHGLQVAGHSYIWDKLDVEDVLTAGHVDVSGNITVAGNSRFGDAITDLVLVSGAVRTYDGTDYLQDIVVSDVPGVANNGVQFAYNITDWDGETTFYALFAETKIVTPTAITACTMYGADFMVRVEGTSEQDAVYRAEHSTGIAMYAEVQAVYTSALATAYAVYGELEAGVGSTITDSSVFYADLVGSGTFGEVDVLSVRAGDTYDYGLNFSPATAMTADIVFQNGTELEEVTDTVLTFSEFLAAEVQSVVVVEDGGWITPTGTNTPISSTGPFSLSCSFGSIYTGSVDGQLLILTNVGASHTITVCDSGIVNMSGDTLLGPEDTLMLMWSKILTAWLEIGGSDN